MEVRKADVAIVGGGIIGLSHAYMVAKKGLRVVLFDRDEFSVGASVRNFGMVWPVGQDPAVGLDYALNSRNHWIEVASKAGFWINQNGSLHIARHSDEWDVMNEFVDLMSGSQLNLELLDRSATLKKSAVVESNGLIGSLWSNTECTVNPREAIRRIPLWLSEKYGAILKFGQFVRDISFPLITTSAEEWKADFIFVCSGADFLSLYPKQYAANVFKKCSLQMMKAKLINSDTSIGPSLCSGLTLRHYASFKKCPSLIELDKRYDIENPLFKKHGIHVLVSQNNEGEIIIGDSHQYGTTLEPFNQVCIDRLILSHFETFTRFDDLSITEHWQGVYPKLENDIFLRLEAEKNVVIVNGFGGAGMTLSFGVAEESINKLL